MIYEKTKTAGAAGALKLVGSLMFWGAVLVISKTEVVIVQNTLAFFLYVQILDEKLLLHLPKQRQFYLSAK